MANESIVVAATPNHAVSLTRKQQSLVAFIEHSPKFASFATAAELAKRVGINAATVVRLAQSLGYSGFPEFQEAIQHRYLASLDAVALMNVHTSERHGDTTLASLDQDIRNLAAARSAIDPETVRRVAALIGQARSVLIVGFGSHAGHAIAFSHNCRVMGIPAEAEYRSGVTLATRLSGLGPDDVVIASSAWWVVRDVRETLTIARERGAKTVVIVDSRTSSITQVADFVFIAPTESVSFFQAMTGPLAVLNAIAAEIAAAGDEEMRRRMDATSEMFNRLGVVWHDAGPSLHVPDNGGSPADDVAEVAAPRKRRRRSNSERGVG